MIYIEKTTMRERTTISNAMTPIFFDLERAESLLDTVHEECFESKGKSVYLTADAKWTMDMIGLVDDILRDAITAFYLTTADNFDDCAKYYLKDAKCVETAMKCGEIFDRICDIERSLPEDQQKRVAEVRTSVIDMDNEKALLILEALLAEQEAHKVKSSK